MKFFIATFTCRPEMNRTISKVHVGKFKSDKAIKELARNAESRVNSYRQYYQAHIQSVLHMMNPSKLSRSTNFLALRRKNACIMQDVHTCTRNEMTHDVEEDKERARRRFSTCEEIPCINRAALRILRGILKQSSSADRNSHSSISCRGARFE